MYLIRKTGERKLLVLQGTASILKGVTIVIVPVLGLGSDQVQKCNIGDNIISDKSCHLDEFKNKNTFKLCTQLNEYTCKGKTAIILFASLQ